MILLALMAQASAEGQEGQIAAIARTFGVDWSHLTAQIISFSIVCAVLYRFAYGPVLRMLDARRQQIALGLANAEKIDTALAGIEADRQKTIAGARIEAAQLIAEARAVGKRVQELETQRAVVTAEQIVAKAREAAALEHQRMLAELRRDVGRLVVQTTAAVVGRVMTPDDERRLAADAALHLSAN